MINYHVPIFLKESLSFLQVDSAECGDVYVDATLGDGGHTFGMAQSLKNKGQIIAIDRDIEAINRTRERLKDFNNIIYIHDNYENLDNILSSQGISKISGIIFDLGISSFQIDLSGRGFSFLRDESLDMRMDANSSISAKDIVNTFPEEEISNIIWKFGEEKWSRRIATRIVEERSRGSIDTTAMLVDIIKKAIPRKFYPQHHVATKTFQALRIAVNKELVGLEHTFKTAIDFLEIGARICIISFHSLEDRIVKNTFRSLEGRCTCPPDLPVCGCQAHKTINILTRKGITPSAEELNDNQRARSARLRVAEKI
ncbi:16S rRNA (cytosine(1402)-N(4))-methyltransferase RsmH [Candidatus Poribacteria bacterium]|nr:16S rRNA (cytosine(1402)-N(4))-methyltransferase RsmH [Candidatus Poribacteria bacterium]